MPAEFDPAGGLGGSPAFREFVLELDHMVAIPTVWYFGDAAINGSLETAANPRTEGAKGKTEFTGTTTSASGAGTLIDTGAFAGMTLAGRLVEITSGSAIGEIAEVASHDDDTLTMTAATNWTVTPGSGDTYTVLAQVVDFDQGLVGLYSQVRNFNRCIPNDPVGAPVTPGHKPAAPAFLPYWDAYFVTVGATADSGSTTTLTDTGNFGGVDKYKGRWVVITAGTNAGETSFITSHTADTLTVSPAFTDPIDNTSVYEIRGEWVVYHHTNSQDERQAGIFNYVPGAKGDNHYALGGGVTPNTMLMHALNEHYGSASPYFKMVKQAFPPGFLNNGAEPWGGATLPTNLTNLIDRVTDAVAYDGDTLDSKLVIIDATMEDIRANTPADYVRTDVTDPLTSPFGAAVQNFITNIKVALPGAHITLVNHHPDMFKATAQTGGVPIALSARAELVAVAALNTGVSVHDYAQYAEFGSPLPLLPDTGSLNALTLGETHLVYRTEDYIHAGTRLYNEWIGAIATGSVATPGAGVKTVILLADSQGGAVSWLFPFYDNVEGQLGPTPGYSREKEWIYNDVTGTVQLYNVLSNAKTFGTVDASNFGPEATLLKRLRETYDDDIVVVKFAVNGMALTSAAATAGGSLQKSAADQWSTLQTGWDRAKIAIITALNRVPDVIGIGVLLGDNDTNEAGAASFAVEAPTFVDDARLMFQTRTDQDPPFVWLQPHQHADNGGPTTHGDPDARESVRSSILSLATAKSRLTVLPSNVTRYEPNFNDKLHYGGEATYNIGYDIADAIVAINTTGAGATVSTDDEPSGAAAFTVETGSGAAGSNSYCSVAAADTFHQEQGNPNAWVVATVAAKNDALRQATSYLDEKYGHRWKGGISSFTQNLLWPRGGAIDERGYGILNNEIPTSLVHATAEVALRVINGADLRPDLAAGEGSVGTDTITVGPISITEDHQGAATVAPTYPEVDHKLRGLLRAGTGGAMRRLTR